jgi:arsenate reductase
MSEFDLDKFEKQELKSNPLTDQDLNFLYSFTNSFEELFSKKSTQYTALGLKNLVLTENDFKKYLLSHYSFLKRPVFIINNKIFIGSDKSTIEKLRLEL